MKKVKRRGGATISAKHQVTIPIEVMRTAGLEVGERVMARADGPGRVVLELEDDALARFSGALTGLFEQGFVRHVRGEWD